MLKFSIFKTSDPPLWLLRQTVAQSVADDVQADEQHGKKDAGHQQNPWRALHLDGALGDPVALDGVAAPRLEIATRFEQRAPDAGYAVVTVCDNGPGIQRELLGRVFDPYVTSKPKGTGLGLAIVKKIVEEHGGRIDADNRPEGGARIRVVLPVTDSTRSAAGTRERRGQLRREIV